MPSYLTFLGLYWMTAPLAWLYGIPYERFLNEVNAAQANVWTLELVSVWRVLLISRVVAVLTPSSIFSAFTKVAVPALAIVFVAISYARMPLIDFMGGYAFRQAFSRWLMPICLSRSSGSSRS